MSFDRLLAPLALSSLTLRNRMVMGAMHTRLETMDQPIQRLTEFYRARAKGGVSLILTGGYAPELAGRMDPESGVLDTPESIDQHGHRAICSAVHSEGAAIVLQILHAGRYAKVPGCVGPSAQRAAINKIDPRPLETAEIWELIERFATTARLAREAGYDGVEIMGSEGYLINEFTAERTNDRRDDFGGDRDGRFRLPVEIVKAVRQAVGRDFLIVYRISAIDLVPGGMPAEEIVDLAQRVEEAGADVINTGIGWHESGVPTIAASVPRAAWTFAVRRVKDAVSIPVIASNRINTPETAEEILSEGHADLVSMARPLLADPDFALKVTEDRVEEICTCIGCNQACLDAIFTDRAATCMVNPRAGREVDFLLPLPTARKNVAVVGAGPAGMAASVELAQRGHRVTLMDAAEAIGGQMNLARMVPGKSEFNEALRYFDVMLTKHGVDRRLGGRITASQLVGAGYDHVVVATGINPRVPAIDGIDHAKVLSYVDVLTGQVEVGEKVAIIGAGGIGFDTAEFLLGNEKESVDPATFFEEWGVDPDIAEGGGLRPAVARHEPSRRTVTIFQRKQDRLGRTLGKSTGWILRSRLARAGLREVAGASYDRIDDRGLHYTVPGVQHVIDVDHVVICAGQESERTLYHELIEAGVEAELIGGAHTAGELDAVAAIAMGTRVATAL